MRRTRGGRRIPDQNLWTGELLDLPLWFGWDPAAGDIRLTYADPRDGDWEHGVLWLRHGQDRSGDYRWKAVNTPRTRVMMREHLCMVCETSCVREDGRVWWLFVHDPDVGPAGAPVTNLPPTCRMCMAEALATCPRLSARARVVTVAGTSPYAATVDLYAPGEGDTLPLPAVKARHEVIVTLGNGNAWSHYALGKQLWLTLHDLRDEPRVLAELRQEAQALTSTVTRHP